MYFTFITLSTVGYGDILPATTPGRCISIIAALMGSFMISLVVVTILS